MVGRLDQLRPQLVRVNRRHRGVIGLVALALAAACSDSRAEARPAAPASQGEGGASVSLDSALTLFRRDLESVAELDDAERSLDVIVARLARAVEQSDTATLRSIVMSRREFAYLYYPTSV